MLKDNIINHLTGDKFLDNPYYEKWKPGRPSKAAIEKRNLSDDWNRDQFMRTNGMMKHLLTPNKNTLIENSAQGVTIKYQSRITK